MRGRLWIPDEHYNARATAIRTADAAAANPYGTIAHTPNPDVWGINWAARGWRRGWMLPTGAHKDAALSRATPAPVMVDPTVAAIPEARITNSAAQFGPASFSTLLPAVVGKPIKSTTARGLVVPVQHSSGPAVKHESKEEEHETNRSDEGVSVAESLEDKKAADKEYALKHPPDLFWMMATIEVDAPMTYDCHLPFVVRIIIFMLTIMLLTCNSSAGVPSAIKQLLERVKYYATAPPPSWALDANGSGFVESDDYDYEYDNSSDIPAANIAAAKTVVATPISAEEAKKVAADNTTDTTTGDASSSSSSSIPVLSTTDWPELKDSIRIAVPAY